MRAESVGVCKSQGRVWIARLRRKRVDSAPELAGWESLPEHEAPRVTRCRSSRAPIRPQQRLGLPVPHREVYVRVLCATQAEEKIGKLSFAEACQRELQAVEPLVTDVARLGANDERCVAVLARRSSLERCRAAAAQLGGTLALATPENFALFALLAKEYPSAESARVAVVHTDGGRAIAGVFDRGAAEALLEVECSSPLEGVTAALRLLPCGQPDLEVIYVSGLSQTDWELLAQAGEEGNFLRWAPLSTFQRAPGIEAPEDARVVLPIALALCALAPDAPQCVNFVRGELAAIEIRARQATRSVLGARAALCLSLVVSSVLLKDSFAKRAARIELKEAETELAERQIRQSSHRALLSAELAVAEEIQSRGLVPLQISESLKPLMRALPQATTLSFLYIDGEQIEIRGSIDERSDVSEAVALASQLLSGAEAQVSQSGDFVVRGRTVAAERKQ